MQLIYKFKTAKNMVGQMCWNGLILDNTEYADLTKDKDKLINHYFSAKNPKSFLHLQVSDDGGQILFDSEKLKFPLEFYTLETLQKKPKQELLQLAFVLGVSNDIIGLFQKEKFIAFSLFEAQNNLKNLSASSKIFRKLGKQTPTSAPASISSEEEGES